MKLIEWINGCMMGKLSSKRKEEIILEYMAYANRIAHDIAVHCNALHFFEEFKASAYLGLVDAADRYDTDFGLKFKSYMITRVRGEVLDFFRRNKDRGFIGDLRRKKGKNVMFLDLVDSTATPPNDAKVTLLSGRVEACHSWYYAVQMRFIKKALAELMDTLPSQCRQVMFLHYYSDLSMKEISGLLGVSGARISQIVNKGLEMLLEKVRDDWNVYAINEVLPSY